MKLTEHHARIVVERTYEELHDLLAVVETRLSAMLRELDRPDVNNMYLYQDATETRVLAKLLRERVASLFKSVDTVSFRA